MIHKTFFPMAHDRPTTVLLNQFTSGKLDGDQLRKIAASNAFVFKPTFEIRPGHSYLHVISTSAGEHYGPNNNADYFNEGARIHKSATGKEIMLGGGLLTHHNTFTKHAHVYEEHFNGPKGGPELGNVLADCYNPDMHRGELLLEVNTEKWAADLEKLATGEHINWSMGCSIPHDICSYCHNKAATASDYCEHVRYGKLNLDKEGNQIYMINDQPMFHDISKVKTPADQIAYTLSKVANYGGFNTREIPTVPRSVVQAIGTAQEKNRYDILLKLAMIEKEIDLTPASEDAILAESCGCDDQRAGGIMEQIGDSSMDSVMKKLSDKGGVMPPRVFIRIATKGNPDVEENLEEDTLGLLPEVFSDALKSGNIDDLLEDGSYMPGRLSALSGNESSKLRGVADELSLEDHPVQNRIVKVTIHGGPVEKMATAKVPTHSKQAAYMAREYAKYMLSAVSQPSTSATPFLRRAIIVKNVN